MPCATVAVLATSPETVLDDYRRLLDLAGAGGVLAPNRPVNVIPELSWHHYIPACSTPPWQLDGVLGALKDAGSTPEQVTVQYAAFPTVDAAKGIILNRHHTVLETQGVRVVNPGEIGEWSSHAPTAKTSALGALYTDGVPLPASLEGSPLVVCSAMKTHARLGVGGTLPVLYDSLLDTKRLRAGARISEAVAETLALTAQLTTGMVAVMDCTVAGEGPGPHRISPRLTNLIVASTDPVALDSWASRMMGVDPLDIPHLRLAHDASLGAVKPDDITVTGDDVPAFESPFASAGAPLGGVLLQTAPGRALTGLYDDWYWYVAVGEKHLKTVMKTGWGRLFEKYRHVV